MNNNKTRPHKVKEKLTIEKAYEYINSGETTYHFRQNEQRISKWFDTLGKEDFGYPIHAFHVDKEHPNGDEVHVITSEGVLLTYNYKTKKAITIQFARDNQMERNWWQRNNPGRNPGPIPVEIKKLSQQYRVFRDSGILINHF